MSTFSNILYNLIINYSNISQSFKIFLKSFTVFSKFFKSFFKFLMIRDGGKWWSKDHHLVVVKILKNVDFSLKNVKKW